MFPCVTSFPRVRRAGSPRPSNKFSVPARSCLSLYSSPSTRLRVLPFDQPSRFLLVGVASFCSCPPYRVRPPVAPWPYYLVPPYRPSRFCSSVWVRFAPARLIASRGPVTLLICPPYRPFFPSRRLAPRVIFYILSNSTVSKYRHYS